MWADPALRLSALLYYYYYNNNYYYYYYYVAQAPFISAFTSGEAIAAPCLVVAGRSSAEVSELSLPGLV